LTPDQKTDEQSWNWVLYFLKKAYWIRFSTNFYNDKK